MLKTILKSTTKNKLISLFLIIEFTITIFLSLQAIESYEIINSKRKIINNMFDVKSTLVVKVKDSDKIGNFKNYYDIPDTLKSIDGVKKVGYYHIEDPSKGIESSMGDIKKYIFINKDMLDIISIKNSKDKKFTGNIFNTSIGENELNPIITGSLLNSHNNNFDISMGDQWKKTYKSIDTSKKNLLFPDNKYMDGGPINLNKSVILLFLDDKTQGNKIDGIKTNAVLNQFFVKIDTENVNALEKLIYDSFDKKGFEVSITTIKEELNNYIKENEGFFIAQLRITICLSIFSILGTSATLMLSVNRRKREFGIRMSTGANKFYILRLVYGEVMLLLVISYVIALMLYLNRSKNILYTLGLKVYQLFNPWFSLKYLLIVFLMLLLFSFTVIKNILKMQPRELIGGVK